MRTEAEIKEMRFNALIKNALISKKIKSPFTSALKKIALAIEQHKVQYKIAILDQVLNDGRAEAEQNKIKEKIKAALDADDYNEVERLQRKLKTA